MARYIDADKLYRRVKEKTNPYGKPTLDYESGFKVLGMIEQELTADVAEVKHGKWLDNVEKTTTVAGVTKDFAIGYRCSLCGRTEINKEPYCNCGAKMDGGAEK